MRSLTRSLIDSSRRAVAITRSPRAAAASAISRPRPELQPVMSQMFDIAMSETKRGRDGCGCRSSGVPGRSIRRTLSCEAHDAQAPSRTSHAVRHGPARRYEAARARNALDFTVSQPDSRRTRSAGGLSPRAYCRKGQDARRIESRARLRSRDDFAVAAPSRAVPGGPAATMIAAAYVVEHLEGDDAPGAPIPPWCVACSSLLTAQGRA